MLDRMSSRTVAEWEAYERLEGSLGAEWTSEALRTVVDLLQQLNHLFGAAFFTDKGHKNPIPEGKPFPRPSQMYKLTQRAIEVGLPLDDEEEDEEDDEDGGEE